MGLRKIDWGTMGGLIRLRMGTIGEAMRKERSLESSETSVPIYRTHGA